jgi:hypothetical protein
LGDKHISNFISDGFKILFNGESKKAKNILLENESLELSVIFNENNIYKNLYLLIEYLKNNYEDYLLNKLFFENYTKIMRVYFLTPDGNLKTLKQLDQDKFNIKDYYPIFSRDILGSVNDWVDYLSVKILK